MDGIEWQIQGVARIGVPLDHAGRVSCGPVVGLWDEKYPLLLLDPVRRTQLKPHNRCGPRVPGSVLGQRNGREAYV